MKYRGAEALCIESSKLKAVFTVRGMKMVSLFDKTSGMEFLLQGGDTLIQGGYDADYGAVDICGFDEMFPNIDACFYEREPWLGVRLPDHGEVWGIDWDHDTGENYIEAHVFGVRMPYKLSKRIYFITPETLRTDYTVQNLSIFDMDFAWTAHAMFELDDDSEIILPEGNTKGVVTFSSNERLGRFGNIADLNDLIYVMPGNVYTDKVYLQGPVSNGICGVGYPSKGRSCMMGFPADTVPYLGVLNSNGMNIGKCAILEPCTGAFDRPDRARAFGMDSVLQAKGTRQWYLDLTIVESN